MGNIEKMGREELIQEALKYPNDVETALICKGKYGGLHYVCQVEGIKFLSTQEIKNICLSDVHKVWDTQKKQYFYVKMAELACASD